MPQFTFEYSEDGTIHRILKDGVTYNESVKLEQVFSIPRTYFQLAQKNLDQMRPEQTGNERRGLGLQSFLMSLTALEAFTNTFFHLRAQELKNGQMLNRIEQKHGSLSRKIAELIAMTPDGPLNDQVALLERVYEFSELRNEIVHPRWAPSGLTIKGDVPIVILGIVENRQALFEDRQLCLEALYWCLLVVARIGQVRGDADLNGFMFHWTGIYGFSLSKLLKVLGVPE